MTVERVDGGDITSESDWFEFSAFGRKYELELGETIDLLGKIDVQHEDDPNQCLECKAKFVLDEEMRKVKVKDRTCPECNSKNIAWAAEYLDDVAKFLRDRVGLPRCSRTEAAVFYKRILLAYDAKKNGPSTTAESDTSTGSTPEDSAEQSE